MSPAASRLLMWWEMVGALTAWAALSAQQESAAGAAAISLMMP